MRVSPGMADSHERTSDMTDHTTHNTSNEIPYGYCHCGCGQKTWISTITSKRLGWTKGEPVNYVGGHGKRKTGTLADNFWSQCLRKSPNECWEWQGGMNGSGYGQLYYRRKQYKTHRLSYELHNGPIPDGMDVCHKCDNRRCCNPHHLFLGTRSENTLDMLQKGRNRAAKGEQCHRAKLTETDIPTIRDLYNHGMTQTAIAQRYDVSQTTIRAVVLRESWKHIP